MSTANPIPVLTLDVESGVPKPPANAVPWFVRPKRGRRLLYQTLAGLGLGAWVLLFTAGAAVNSQPYRDTLKGHFNWGDLVNTMLFWSPTNICLLSLLAALIGGCASSSFLPDDLLQRIEDTKAIPGQENASQRLKRRLWYMYESPAVSMLRGLFVYVIFLSGLLVVDSKPFSFDNDSDAQAAYMRLAGLLSGFAFIFGFDPTKCEEMMDKVGNPVNKPQNI